MRENIVLIGFMGSGKTTVGRVLAKKLEYSFLDTDALIVEKEGKSISSIFDEQGEPYFRNAETRALEELEQNLQHTIVSTGGGLVLRECNGAIIKRLGFVVFLKTQKQTVRERLREDTTRPLLRGDNAEAKIEELLVFRNPIYEYTAHLTIETDNRTVEEIAEEIVRNFRLLTVDRSFLDAEE